MQDMFWPPSPFDLNASIASCVAQWGATPRPYWATLSLAGSDLRAASNIVFSNGVLDPWSAGGVTANISASVHAVLIPNGAHHLDLMFADPRDPPDVLAARAFEVEQMRQWIREAGRGTTR